MADFTSLDPHLLVSQSLATNFMSKIVDARDYDRFSITCTLTLENTPAGALVVEVGDDSTNWQQLGSSINIGAETSFIIEANGLLARYFRLRYTSTSGGNGDIINAVLTMKGV